MQLQSALKSRQQRHAPRRTFLIEPFDIGMHSTEARVSALQTHFTSWRRP